MSWGPWIEHDNKGCPVKGMFIEIEKSCGCKACGITYEFDAKFWSPLCSAASCEGCETLHPPHSQIVIRYRIRKPRGLTTLEEMVANPEKVPPEYEVGR